MANVLLEDTVEVKNVDEGGKKFQKVSRIVGVTDLTEMDFVLDVNSEIYKVKPGNNISFSITTSVDSINEIGKDESVFDPEIGTKDKPSLVDSYEYVMYGRVFKYKVENNQKASIYVSFGGLLLKLTGSTSDLSLFEEKQQVYLLMKTVKK